MTCRNNWWIDFCWAICVGQQVYTMAARWFLPLSIKTNSSIKWQQAITPVRDASPASRLRSLHYVGVTLAVRVWTRKMLLNVNCDQVWFAESTCRFVATFRFFPSVCLFVCFFLFVFFATWHRPKSAVDVNRENENVSDWALNGTRISCSQSLAYVGAPKLKPSSQLVMHIDGKQSENRRNIY